MSSVADSESPLSSIPENESPLQNPSPLPSLEQGISDDDIVFDDIEGDEDELTPPQASQASQASRRRHCTQYKLQYMVRALQKVRWSFKSFLRAWARWAREIVS